MSNLRPDLIYDVGLHRGEDTDFYLTKGFNVVAIEANPELVAICKARFRDAIAAGRLHILEGAIAPLSAGSSVTFYINKRSSIWGTIDPSWAERNARLGFASEKIELPRIDIDEVYRSFGIPFYLKIDVEGVDRLVLESIKAFEDRPRFVSVESEKVDFEELRSELALLRDLGYSKFKPVQQASVRGSEITTTTRDGRAITHRFETHASGPFGDDIPQPWLDFDETLREYEHIFVLYRRFGDASIVKKLPGPIKKIVRKGYAIWTGHHGPLPGWYDTHASL